MRRLASISLLAVFMWLLVAPAFGPDAEANLPACCRRNGKHHCAMRWMAQRDAGFPGLTTVSEKCPCGPAAASAVHSGSYYRSADSSLSAHLSNQPTALRQAEPLLRISLPGGHSKRGPPMPLA